MKLSAKQWVISIVTAAVLADLAWAGDVWKEKKPADWSEKDMEKFLTRSPWARTVQPASTPPSMDQGPAGTNTGGWGGGAPGGGGGGGWRGDMSGGGMGGAMPIMTFHVRWVSAPIMREALKVAEPESDLLNSAIENYARDYYVVSVSMQVEGGTGSGGRDPRGGAPGRSNWGGGQWGAGQGASKDQQDEGRKRFEAALIQGAILRFGRRAVHPAKAEMKPSKAGMTTLYMFPRDLKLEQADKDYVFEFTQNQIVTRANFNLKGFEQAPEKGL